MRKGFSLLLATFFNAGSEALSTDIVLLGFQRTYSNIDVDIRNGTFTKTQDYEESIFAEIKTKKKNNVLKYAHIFALLD